MNHPVEEANSLHWLMKDHIQLAKTGQQPLDTTVRSDESHTRWTKTKYTSFSHTSTWRRRGRVFSIVCPFFHCPLSQLKICRKRNWEISYNLHLQASFQGTKHLKFPLTQKLTVDSCNFWVILSNRRMEWKIQSPFQTACHISTQCRGGTAYRDSTLWTQNEGVLLSVIQPYFYPETQLCTNSKFKTKILKFKQLSTPISIDLYLSIGII